MADNLQGDPQYIELRDFLNAQSINTPDEVQDFRVPGERDDVQTSPTQGEMFAALATIETNLGWTKGRVSRRRLRHDALRLLKEGQLV